MSLWDKLQSELDRAGSAAKDAIDEGRIRIELFRIRQLADKAAESLGYAIHRAKRDGQELAPETLARLEETLGKHEAEAKKLEDDLAAIRAREKKGGAKDGEPTATETPAGAAADAAGDAGASPADTKS